MLFSRFTSVLFATLLLVATGASASPKVNQPLRLPLDGDPYDIAFSPDGKWVAATSGRDWGRSPDRVDVWKVTPSNQGALLVNQHFSFPMNSARTLCFSRDSTLLACTGYDELARIDLRNGKSLTLLDSGENSGSVAQTWPGANTLIYDVGLEGDGFVVRDLGTGKILRRINVLDEYEPPRVDQCAFSPDKKMIAWPLMEGKIMLFDSESGHRKQLPLLSYEPSPGEFIATSLLFSPDGKRLLCQWAGDQNQSVSHQLLNHWAMWDMSEGKIVRKWQSGEWQEAFFVPQGLSFITAQENALILSEASSGRIEGKFKISGKKAEKFTLAPNGKLLACASSDGVLQVWNVQ